MSVFNIIEIIFLTQSILLASCNVVDHIHDLMAHIYHLGNTNFIFVFSNLEICIVLS